MLFRSGPEGSADSIVVIIHDVDLDTTIHELLDECVGSCQPIESLRLDGLAVVVDVTPAEETVARVGIPGDASHLTSSDAILTSELSLFLLLGHGAAAIDIVRRGIKRLAMIVLAVNDSIHPLLVR